MKDSKVSHLDPVDTHDPLDPSGQFEASQFEEEIQAFKTSSPYPYDGHDGGGGSSNQFTLTL